MSAEICRLEIEKNMGVMYDPRIAELCLTNWEYVTGEQYTGEQNMGLGMP